MKVWIKTYLIALVTFLVVDGLWIGLYALKLYSDNLDGIMRKAPMILPALLFYCVFVAGLTVFVILPSKKFDVDFIVKSALYGAVCYGTYALTNLSIVENWSMCVSVIDILWGVSVSTITASITLIFMKKSIKREK